MKKVLSVLLAAAMVMGMSVSAFAANTANVKYTSWGYSSTGTCYHNAKNETEYPMGGFSFAPCFWVNSLNDAAITEIDDEFELNVGDDLYFQVWNNDEAFTGKADEHWSINIKSNKYVENADWYHDGHNLYVKVEIVDELDDLDSQDVEFKMYLADNKGEKNNNQSQGVKLDLAFDNYKEEYVNFDFTNDVDYTAKWIVKKGEKGTATFDFEDEAYFTVKMVSEEKVILNFESLNFVKAIDKAFDYEAEYTTYNFKGDSDSFYRTGELFIPADEDTFIYAWEDGKLVEVDAKYVEDYKVDGLNKKDGWVLETNELGYYVVSDVEVTVEETETPAEETNKANPETGAADFVGAAVAMAVVSVAAAGALALKK